MARLWYSVHGEGWGHALRSSVVIEELMRRHTLLVTASGKAYPYLRGKFPALPVLELSGLSIVYRDNKVVVSQTLKAALRHAPTRVRHNLQVLFGEITRFAPDVVLSDFEPFANYAAPLLRRPLLTINNISLLPKAKVRFSPKQWAAFVRATAVIKLLEGNATYSFIPSFVRVPVRGKKARLVPPILRPEILAAAPTDGDYVLVYQTSRSYAALLRVLKSARGTRFVCYNLGRTGTDGNLAFKAFADEEFIADLAGCQAVLTNGGFTLITEALHLGKPVLSVPIAGQLEQIFNARLLERAGYGMSCARLTKPCLQDFLGDLEAYRARLARYPRHDNARLFAALERAIRTAKPGRGVPRAFLPLVRKMARVKPSGR